MSDKKNPTLLRRLPCTGATFVGPGSPPVEIPDIILAAAGKVNRDYRELMESEEYRIVKDWAFKHEVDANEVFQAEAEMSP